MKNRYCSFFLYIFLIDAVLNILRNLANLLGLTLLGSAPMKVAEGVFHSLFIVLAIVQVIIAFRNKLKWSAKIIGLYPLFFAVVALIVGIFMMQAQKPVINANNLLQISRGLSVYLLSVSILQLLIGIWARRDLSKTNRDSDR
jgi:hypothetical protein